MLPTPTRSLALSNIVKWETRIVMAAMASTRDLHPIYAVPLWWICRLLHLVFLLVIAAIWFTIVIGTLIAVLWVARKVDSFLVSICVSR